MAEAGAGLAVAVAAVFCYWAAGARSGSPARSRPRPGRCRRPGQSVLSSPWPGSLGLACRRGPRIRSGLPAALAWIGSGTLAAFDGLELFLTFGTGLSGSGWSLTDTVLVIEVAIGVLCAAVGALAVTAAVKDAA